MSSIIEGLIEDYIKEYREHEQKRGTLDKLMQVSEPSFGEWDNPEDEVYNNL